MLLFAPIMLPIAISVGMDPVHFGLVFCALLVVSCVTPPVGMTLFVISGITKVSLERICIAIIPFAIVSIIIIIALAYLPGVVLFIPNL
jgi:TRAP-type C4-dicarboxylate transport system permease large subunit